MNYHCYGYRRTWLALKRDGVDVGRDRVKRLMGAWDPGRQAPRQAVAYDDAGPGRRQAAGPRPA